MSTSGLIRVVSIIGLSLFLVLPSAPAGQRSAHHITSGRAERDPWDSLPFTAREWARQSLLPYRQIPLKRGGSMSVQEAYDLYLKAGQPEYPDMSTPGLVTEKEIAEQVKLSAVYNRTKQVVRR